MEIKNSRFYENTVLQGNAVAFGGDASTGSVLIDNCIVENNNCSAIAGSSGGAFYINNSATDITVKNSIIRNNTVAGDGAAFALYTDMEKTASVASILRVESTLIANNFANNGSAFAIKNAGANFPAQVAVINSTVYKNESKTYGAFFVQDGCVGSSLKLINSTVVENTTQGFPTFTAGIRIEANANMFKGFYNTIVEGNVSRMAATANDLWFTIAHTESVNMEIRNSYIGYISWGTGGKNPYLENTYGNVLGYNLTKKAGLSEPAADFIASRGCVPLGFESDATIAGDAQYLQALGITTDQEGVTRSFADGKCAVGAVETPYIDNIVPGEAHNYTHYIISGQSLSTGHQSDPISITNEPGNYMIGDRIWMNGENGNHTFDVLNPLVATTAPGSQSECPLHGAVNHLRHKIPLTVDADGRENRFLASSVGTSGRSIEELSKEYTGTSSAYLYADYIKTLKSAYSIAMRRNSTINCPAIIFMQGEWNYLGGNGLTPGSEATLKKDEYKDLFVKLKNNMQADVKAQYKQTNAPTFYTYQTGAQYTRGLSLEIGMAQLEAANKYDDVVMVGPVYPYPDANGHLDANGYRWYGEMIGKVIYKTQVLGEKFSPLQPIKISRVPENPKQIRIQYHVPVPPLVFDTHTLLPMQNQGFDLVNNSTTQTITNIEIDDDCVVLTSSSNLNGRIRISYAGDRAQPITPFPGFDGKSNGNLRDSDDYGSFFTYVNRTWTGDNYTRSDHPRDEQGNIIYDKPYPLYNFGVAYYYDIPADVNEYIVPNAPGNESGNSIGTNSKDNNTTLRQVGSDLQLNVATGGVVELGIYGISGNLATSYTSKNIPAGVQNYSLSGLPQGMYIAKASVNNNLYSAKIIIK
jgi:hypothetical protein